MSSARQGHRLVRWRIALWLLGACAVGLAGSSSLAGPTPWESGNPPAGPVAPSALSYNAIIPVAEAVPAEQRDSARSDSKSLDQSLVMPQRGFFFDHATSAKSNQAAVDLLMTSEGNTTWTSINHLSSQPAGLADELDPANGPALVPLPPPLWAGLAVLSGLAAARIRQSRRVRPRF